MSINNQPIFQEYVTPEEVNALPLTYYEGEIVLIDEPEKVNEAVEEIKQHSVIGFDTETKPTFVKGQFYRRSIRLLYERNPHLYSLEYLLLKFHLHKYCPLFL